MTIVLADDHAIVREGLRRLLEREPDLQVVGETGDGLEAVHLIERLQPHIALLDLTMPGLSGLEVIRQVAKVAPDTKVIVFSVHAADPYVLEALKQGVAGYVLKGSSNEELMWGVREVIAGRHFLSAPLSEQILQRYLDSLQTDEMDPYETLTRREREVLHLAAEGHTSEQIAERFSISPRTVKDHRLHLMHKLGLASQTDLVRYALRKGILPPE